MTADRKPTYRVNSVTLKDGRYLRWSWRYNSWQVKDRHGLWRAVRPEIARCYAAAGMMIGVQT